MASFFSKPKFLSRLFSNPLLLNRSFKWKLIKNGGERLMSHWHLKSSVCLERKPIISAEFNSLEKKYWQMLQKMEFEGSLLSDNEIRHNEDIARADKLRLEESDVLDLDAALKETAQDAEDAYIEEYNSFKASPRISAHNEDKKSLERHLDKPLLLVVRKKLGNDFRWLLPDNILNQGETLQQSCQKICKDFMGEKTKPRFLGKAPVGYYKYKYPKVVREGEIYGAKIFFFKAQIKNGEELCKNSIEKNSLINVDYAWLTRAELKEYLHKDYCNAIEKFLTWNDNFEESLKAKIEEISKEWGEMLPEKSAARSS